MILSAGILSRFRVWVARNTRDARGPSEWTTAPNGKNHMGNDKSSCRTPRLTSPRARFLLVCALTIAAVLLDAAFSLVCALTIAAVLFKYLAMAPL